MNEADTDQSKDHTVEPTPNLDTPKQTLVGACQEYIHNRDHTSGKPEQDITIETVGKCLGRNRKPVPSADVFKLAAIGCKDTEIAEWFGVDSNTLRYNFSVELLKGRETLKQSLRRKQIEVAMSGNPTMLIFLGKNLLGQSDSPLSSQEAQVLPWEDD
jgi:hypothetical protein